MKYRFIDKDSNVLDFTGIEYAINVSPIDYSISNKTSDRLRSYGSNVLTDGYFSSRKVDVEFHVINKTDLGYIEALNKVTYFFRAGQGPFYLENWEDNGATNYRRILVVPDGLKESFSVGLEKRFGTYKLNFICPDGLWELSEKTVSINPYVSGGFDVTLAQYSLETYFEITFTTSDIGNYTILNTTTGRYMTIESTASNQLIIIDGRGTGSIKFTATENNSAIRAGTFVNLISGINTITISRSGSEDVGNSFVLKYRERLAY